MTFLENTGRAVALSFLTLKSRFKNNPENFKKTIRNTSRVFICLPANEQERDAAQNLFPEWKTCFPNAEIIGMNPDSEQTPTDKRIITLEKHDINIWGIPGKRIKDLLVGKPVDIAIDLNRDYDAMSTLLVLMSRAHLRAGYFHEEKTRLYNFLLRTSPEKSTQHAIQALLTYFKTIQ
ncbi:MAG: hypothetical protein U5R06_20830 [candidate division KSB1 bacterium]|nr:hypothetical protein [candidate division KSB1 bacterium]